MDKPKSTASPEPDTPLGAGLDLQDPVVTADLFEQASEANLDSRWRDGATVNIPGRHKILMTGDLHDHGLNLQRILKLAALHESDKHNLILHEIIHGTSFINGRDLSVRTLARVAALKLQYPEQLHLLQANHELAQLGGEGISKDGQNVVKAFDDGIDFIYDDQAEIVRDAMLKFIRSLLLVVRLENGVFCSHSVPSPRMLKGFDFSVIDRVPTDQDLAPRGSAYNMVWGRNHTPESVKILSGHWKTNLFVMGHQPADMGYVIETPRMLVLASDHSHGMALPMKSSSIYDMDRLIEAMVPLASVAI